LTNNNRTIIHATIKELLSCYPASGR